MKNDDVVDVLNDLIETCHDGQYGFSSSAEHVKSNDLRLLFTQRAADCQRAAEELQGLVVEYGGKPDDGGSASGAVHRGWVSVKGTLAGYSDKAMLEECERGEDAAVARYRKALKEELPANVRALVERQLMGAQRNHDQVKALRDQARQAV